MYAKPGPLAQKVEQERRAWEDRKRRQEQARRLSAKNAVLHMAAAPRKSS